ncbi:MAG: 23S rRNA (pseudouridine(1915)-N(3))-methyltransferase RlmH [Candidatus Omnitrophica bacterium]|nr:23S rRNA (pseudouridine(1915)-N(3))-methyltransferase RlmH [Candidatus Omnitrophota bacterium]
MLSSEQIAQELKKVEQSGARALRIIIGGADGFEEKEIEEFKANLLWSFGPLTLPHELAAVVAAEQIYRASTILRAHPYHLGH